MQRSYAVFKLCGWHSVLRACTQTSCFNYSSLWRSLSAMSSGWNVPQQIPPETWNLIDQRNLIRYQLWYVIRYKSTTYLALVDSFRLPSVAAANSLLARSWTSSACVDFQVGAGIQLKNCENLLKVIHSLLSFWCQWSLLSHFTALYLFKLWKSEPEKTNRFVFEEIDPK